MIHVLKKIKIKNHMYYSHLECDIAFIHLFYKEYISMNSNIRQNIQILWIFNHLFGYAALNVSTNEDCTTVNQHRNTSLHIWFAVGV